MFRNIARVTKSSWSASTFTRSTVIRTNRRFSVAAGTIAPTSKPNFRHHVKLFRRSYSAAPGEDKTPTSSSEQQETPQEIPWLDLLESASKAPWLKSTPSDHQDRLRRAYSLLFHVILYLGRPLTKEIRDAEVATQQFLLAFNSALVSPDSEIGRARYAIGLLTKTITEDISTVPQSASIRTEHSQIFALADALVPLCNVYLEGLVQGTAPATGEVVGEGKWQDFWTKAQPVVLALGEELDKEGYGLNEELMKEAKQEQERKDRQAAMAADEEKK